MCSLDAQGPRGCRRLVRVFRGAHKAEGRCRRVFLPAVARVQVGGPLQEFRASHRIINARYPAPQRLAW